jgi:hypothetical protein
MWIRTDEAVEIYARYCRARYGANAKWVVAKRATELGEQGDTDGERAWRAVSRKIEGQAN